MVNRKMKPTAHNMGVRNSMEPPHIVAIQEKIFTPVGTAITIVAATKYACTAADMPVVYMWCAHTMKPMPPIATIAYAMPRYPNTGLREKVEMIWLTMP